MNTAFVFVGSWPLKSYAAAGQASWPSASGGLTGSQARFGKDDAQEQLVEAARARTLRDCVEALEPGYREVLVMREWEDMSYREIAYNAGLPIGTVMSRLSRARKHIRQRMVAGDANCAGRLTEVSEEERFAVMWKFARMAIALRSLLVLALVWLTSAAAVAAPEDDGLRMRIFHRAEGAFQGEACEWKTALPGPAQGKRVVEVFPADNIAAIEIQGDETILPSALLLRFLTEGRFAPRTPPIAVGTAPPGRLWLKNKSCMSFNVLLNPADGQIAGVRT